jgi:hypothetical protein
MKDSFACKIGLAVPASLVAAAILFMSPFTAFAQQSKDRDIPAIYYFPETPSEPANQRAPQRPLPTPQANGMQIQSPALPQYGLPQQAPGSYAPGAASDATPVDQPIPFNVDEYCAAPDASGKARSAAWIKNCVSAATEGPDAPTRKAREQLLEQQQNAGAAGQLQ